MPNMDGILLGPGPLAIAVTKPYSSSYLWKNGEYCTQNGKIYKFISTDLEETGETWTPAHWAETKLTDEIIGLGQRIDSLDPESGVGLFTDIAFEINTNQWVEDSINGVWNYNYSNSLIKATSGIAVYYDNSYASALSGHISVTKNTGYVTFTTNGQPQNRLTGTLRIVDSVSGVLPVSSGGTGAVTSKGARTNLNVSIKPICVNFGTVSSLPQTLTDINNPLYADINANMIPSKWVFGNPAACPNGLKCTTAAGAVTISLPDANSTFSGETTVYLELVDPQTSADSGTGSNDQQYTGDFVQIGAQSLTTTQKAQARTNIGAANAEDVSTLSEHLAKYRKSIATNVYIETLGEVCVLQFNGYSATNNSLLSSDSYFTARIPIGINIWNVLVDESTGRQFLRVGISTEGKVLLRDVNGNVVNSANITGQITYITQNTI